MGEVMPEYSLDSGVREPDTHQTKHCSYFQLVSAPRSCTRDEGRSLGAGLQGQAPNPLKLLPAKAGGGER